MMISATIQATPCAHPRPRASQYDEGRRWVHVCRDCGHRESSTSGTEGYRRMRGARRGAAPVLVGDEGADSGRFASLACLG